MLPNATPRIISYTLEEYRETLSMERYTAEFLDIPACAAACQACPRYSTCWACPPYDVDALEFLQRFQSMEVIATKVNLHPEQLSPLPADEADSYKTETFAMVKLIVEDKLLALERAAQGSVAMTPGSCMRCPHGCKRAQGEPCVSPDTLRYTLEAFGGDLGKLVKNLFDLEFCWTAPGEIPDYYLMVSALLLPHS